MVKIGAKLTCQEEGMLATSCNIFDSEPSDLKEFNLLGVVRFLYVLERVA
jgi:hypothetical protein